MSILYLKFDLYLFYYFCRPKILSNFFFDQFNHFVTKVNHMFKVINLKLGKDFVNFSFQRCIKDKGLTVTFKNNIQSNLSKRLPPKSDQLPTATTILESKLMSL